MSWVGNIAGDLTMQRIQSSNLLRFASRQMQGIIAAPK